MADKVRGAPRVGKCVQSTNFGWVIVITDDVLRVGNHLRVPRTGGVCEGVQPNSGLEGLAHVGGAVQIGAFRPVAVGVSRVLRGHQAMIRAWLHKDVPWVTAIIATRVIVYTHTRAPANTPVGG